MEGRELLTHLLGRDISHEGPTPVSMLAVLRDSGPLSVKTLANEFGITRRTVYHALQPCEIGLVDRSESGYQLLGGGFAALDAVETAQRQVPGSDLAWLAGASSRPEVLTVLGDATEPRKKADLGQQENLPSRVTVHRIIEAAVERGWCIRSDGFLLTGAGETTLAVYRRLKHALDQAVAKSPFLRHLGPRSTSLPLASLDEAELVVIDDDTRPHATLSASIEAAGIRDGGVDGIRTVCPVFSDVMFDAFSDLIDRKTTIEVVFDRDTYRELTYPNRLHHLAPALVAPNVSFRIHPESLDLGVATYDDAVLLVSRAADDAPEAGISGNSSELHEWASERIDSRWATAREPSEQVRHVLQRYAPDWLHDEDSDEETAG